MFRYRTSMKCPRNQSIMYSAKAFSGRRFELPLAAWHRTARWRVALLAMLPRLDLGPFSEISPHGTREGLDEAGVLAAIPRRGGGWSGPQTRSRPPGSP